MWDEPVKKKKKKFCIDKISASEPDRKTIPSVTSSTVDHVPTNVKNTLPLICKAMMVILHMFLTDLNRGNFLKETVQFPVRLMFYIQLGL